MRPDFAPAPDAARPDAHPASVAWRRAAGGPAPERVEALRPRPGRADDASRLFRLGFAGRPAVVAKWASAATLRTEARVYREVLPAAGVRGVPCHGLVEAADGAWLFLGEARGRRYQPDERDHRLAAADWLAAMHAGTAVVDLGGLPPVGRGRYRGYLRDARRTLRLHRDHPAFGADDRRAVGALRALLDRVDEAWDDVTGRWDAFPTCLVHGDFIGKNVLVETTAGGPALHVLDWEAAGAGVPAEDLGALDWTLLDLGGADAARYRARAWPGLPAGAVAHLRDLGVLCQYLAWVRAESTGLATPYVERTVAALGAYARSLRLVGERLGVTAP